MCIVFQIRLNRLQWCNGYIASLPRWRPRFDSRGRKYFYVFLLTPFLFYMFCNTSLVAFYIKFNVLAKSSHQPLFINFQTQMHYHSCGYRYAVMSDMLINKVFNKIHKFVQPFVEVKVSISLLILKAGSCIQRYFMP